MSYPYSPRPTTLVPQKATWPVTVQPEPFRLRPLFALAMGGVFLLGLFLLRGLGSAVYYAQTRHLPTLATYIDATYAQTVSQKSDPLHAATVATELLQKKYPVYAAMQFARASELDPNFRDASYGYAYALLQAKKDQLTAEDKKEIYASIDKAERVDPLYKPLLELKLLMAKLDNNKDVQIATSARLELLR